MNWFQAQLEQGFDRPAWRALLLARCKASLERGTGPPHKAGELRPDNLNEVEEPEAPVRVVPPAEETLPDQGAVADV